MYLKVAGNCVLHVPSISRAGVSAVDGVLGEVLLQPAAGMLMDNTRRVR
jgi:hypothetical protein